MFNLLLFYYWLLVSASKGHHQANIYKKKLKMLLHIVQKHQLRNQWRTQEFFRGGFNKFSWGQSTERTGIWWR